MTYSTDVGDRVSVIDAAAAAAATDMVDMADMADMADHHRCRPERSEGPASSLVWFRSHAHADIVVADVTAVHSLRSGREGLGR